MVYAGTDDCHLLSVKFKHTLNNANALCQELVSGHRALCFMQKAALPALQQPYGKCASEELEEHPRQPDAEVLNGGVERGVLPERRE